MADTNTSALVVSSESSESSGAQVMDTNMNQLQPSSTRQVWSYACGPVAILWDIENCPVPSDVRPEDVAGNIRMALQVHPVIQGAVTVFSAYGDFNAFPKRLRQGCQRTGVKLVDVPNGRKDAADKAILVDMFLFALDNRPPSSILLISGDVDFAPALHILGQRGYNVILVIPSRVDVSSALCNAGRFVWDWPSVARGEGFVPPTKAIMSHRGRPADFAGYMMGCHNGNNPDCQIEEESIIYSGVSQGYYNARDFSIVSRSLSEYNCTSSINMLCFPATLRSQSDPSGLNEVSAGIGSSANPDESTCWVQPGDLNGLKGQLIRLLELFGGCLPLIRVPCEYRKTYGRPLYVSEYGACKLVNIFKKMADIIAVGGKGEGKFVYLRNVQGGPSAAPLVLARKDTKRKETQDESTVGSSDDFSDNERLGETDQRIVAGEADLGQAIECQTDKQFIEQFKYELQEILVCYSCQIFLSDFEAIYRQRYKKLLDYQRFGMNALEELFDKVRDIAVLYEQPVSKRQIVAAIGG